MDSPRPSSANRTILVVDDHPGVRGVLVEMLGLLGCDAVGAAGGEAALDLLERRSFALMITDYDMPGMTGAELAEIVRRRHPAMPIVKLSGTTHFHGAASGERWFDRSLGKPISLAALREVVGLANPPPAGD